MVRTRHADQCAKRWQTVLCQSGERASIWTDQDDESLLQAVDLYGQQWKLITEQYFQGKSAADVRGRYTELTDSSPQCTAEGEPASPPPNISLVNDFLYGTHEDMDFGLDPLGMMPTFASEGLNSEVLASDIFPTAGFGENNSQMFATDCQSVLPATPLSSSSTAISAALENQMLGPHPTTLTLMDVQPNTLCDVLGILMRDNVKVSVAINGP
jgi:hypothetical protein